MDKIEVTRYTDHIYNMKEIGQQDPAKPAFGYVDAWLYVGSERAALVDTLDNAPGLYEEVRKITALPVDVFLTHGHGDHAGVALQEFAETGCRIYMDFKDNEILPEYVEREWLTPLLEGQIFSLGDRKLEVLSCPGHTQGSVAFLDREQELLFSGDTIGSGSIWLQLPYSEPLAVCGENFRKVKEQIASLKDLQIFPGHICQAVKLPMGQSYLDDLIHCVEGVLSGEISGTPQKMDFHGSSIAYGLAGFGQMEGMCYQS